MPQIFARLGVSASTSIEGFYQFAFVRSAPSQCGTFYSGVDIAYSDGCNAVTVARLRPRRAGQRATSCKRADNVLPGDGGSCDPRHAHGRCLGDQVRRVCHAVSFAYGLQRRDQVAAHRRGAVPSRRPRWPEPEVPHGIPRRHPHVRPDVRDPLRDGQGFGELTYRPNQPLQFNAADLLGAVSLPLAPTTLRSQERALPPGGTLSGFERHKNVQLQLPARSARSRACFRRDRQLGSRDRLQGRARPSRPVGDSLRTGRRLRPGAGERGLSGARGADTMHVGRLRLAPCVRLPPGRPWARYANVAEGMGPGPVDALRPGRLRRSGDTAISRGPESSRSCRCARTGAAGSPPTSHGCRPGAARTTTSAIAAPCRCRSASDSPALSLGRARPALSWRMSRPCLPSAPRGGRRR